MNERIHEILAASIAELAANVRAIEASDPLANPDWRYPVSVLTGMTAELISLKSATPL